MITTATVASLTSRTELGAFVRAGRVVVSIYSDGQLFSDNDNAATFIGPWSGSRWDAFTLASDIRDANPGATMALTEEVNLTTGIADSTYWVTTDNGPGSESTHAVVSYYYPLHTL